MRPAWIRRWSTRDRLKVPWAYQVVREARRDFIENGVRVVPAERFLAALP